MVTMGNQASGETGLKSCTMGFKAPLNGLESPEAMPSGTATMVAITKPSPTVFNEVNIWSMKVGLPV